MPAAIVNICVDPRLQHEVLRPQVRTRLEAMGLKADRIFITNDIGGNIGSAMRSTLEMLSAAGDDVVLTAVLHHDDCVADSLGRRRSLVSSVRDLSSLVAGLNLICPVLSGSILTETSEIVWSDRPWRNLETFTFRMPRLTGR
jgi:hypothetical protein